ncbi:hypothetical protein FAI41_05685 [Acetobacteraceae bacterium]|nr:hypothetical protein FAI41_05685 [Acetobacteraceae bacterium]
MTDEPEEESGEMIHVRGQRPNGGGGIRPNNPGFIPPAPHVNSGVSRPELGGGGNGLYQGDIIKDIVPPPAKDGKAYIIAGTIIGGVRTGTQEDETITGATIEDATIIIHPDSAHPQAGGKTVHTKLSHCIFHQK